MMIDSKLSMITAETTNEAMNGHLKDREDLGQKLINRAEMNNWINTSRVKTLSPYVFMCEAQSRAVVGTDVKVGLRSPGIDARLVNGETVTYIAPETHLETLLQQLSNKIESLLSEPSVNVEALKCWATTILIAIHPFHDGNGRVARTLMAYLDKRRGVDTVAIPDSSENFYQLQQSHEMGLSMMVRIFLRKQYPEFAMSYDVAASKKNKSKLVIVMEQLAQDTGKSYDAVIQEMINFSIDEINADTINTHPIVREAAEMSDSLLFDRSDVYRQDKMAGIAFFPIN